MCVCLLRFLPGSPHRHPGIKWANCPCLLNGKSRGAGDTAASVGLHWVTRELQCASGLFYMGCLHAVELWLLNLGSQLGWKFNVITQLSSDFWACQLLSRKTSPELAGGSASASGWKQSAPVGDMALWKGMLIPVGSSVASVSHQAKLSERKGAWLRPWDLCSICWGRWPSMAGDVAMWERPPYIGACSWNGFGHFPFSFTGGLIPPTCCVPLSSCFPLRASAFLPKCTIAWRNWMIFMSVHPKAVLILGPVPWCWRVSLRPCRYARTPSAPASPPVSKPVTAFPTFPPPLLPLISQLWTVFGSQHTRSF